MEQGVEEMLGVEEAQGAQEAEEMPGAEQNIRHYFFVVIHGQTVSPTLICHDLNTPFKNSRMNFFITTNDTLYAEPSDIKGVLNKWKNKDISFNEYIVAMHGSDAFNTDVVISDPTGKVCIPPLTFMTNSRESEKESGVYDIIGIYHLNYTPNAEGGISDDTQFRMYRKLFDWEKFNKMGAITYSDIFSIINKYIKKPGDALSMSDGVIASIRDDNVDIGFFACRTFSDKYKNDYPLDYYHMQVSTLKPTGANKYVPYREEARAANILTKSTYNPSLKLDIFLGDIPHDIFVQTLKSWRGPLAGAYSKGCGLNVLSFYKIIEQSYAREKVACLSVKGTSIFKIIDYINNKYEPDVEDPNTTYSVIRTTLDYGLEVVLNGLHQFAESNRQVNGTINAALQEIKQIDYLKNVVNVLKSNFTIIKMYKTNRRDDTVAYSEIGHTIALGVNELNVYCIDPQTEWYYEFNTSDIEQMKREIIEHYNGSFVFCDLIGVVLHPFGRPFFPKLTELLTLGDEIVMFRKRPISTNYGGKRKTTRKIKKKLTSHNSHLSRNNKK